MKTVLIIDDSDILRMTIKEIVTNNGYKVVGEASNGNSGIEKYKELKPDLVTMDITMDDMDGIDALKQIIRADAKAKVIVISAMGQDVVVRDAIMAGAKGFIVKPFSEQQIMDAFNKP